MSTGVSVLFTFEFVSSGVSVLFTFEFVSPGVSVLLTFEFVSSGVSVLFTFELVSPGLSESIIVLSSGRIIFTLPAVVTLLPETSRRRL